VGVVVKEEVKVGVKEQEEGNPVEGMM